MRDTEERGLVSVMVEALGTEGGVGEGAVGRDGDQSMAHQKADFREDVATASPKGSLRISNGHLTPTVELSYAMLGQFIWTKALKPGDIR
ncbi:hypothetical protein ACSSS7_001149 [Eimeria intestinalis]